MMLRTVEEGWRRYKAQSSISTVISRHNPDYQPPVLVVRNGEGMERFKIIMDYFLSSSS